MRVLRSASAVLVFAIAGCNPEASPISPSPSAGLSPGSPLAVPVNVSVAIHPNVATNDALVIGTIEVEGACLFIVTPDGLRLGVAWPAGTTWNPFRTSITVRGQEAIAGEDVEIGGGSADVTSENIASTPWIVRPLPECLGDGFIFAGSVEPAASS